MTNRIARYYERPQLGDYIERHGGMFDRTCPECCLSVPADYSICPHCGEDLEPGLDVDRTEAERHGSAQGRVRGRAWIYFDVILAPLLVVAGSLTIAADFYLGLLLAFEVYGWRCLWGVAAVGGMFAYLVCEGRRK